MIMKDGNLYPYDKEAKEKLNSFANNAVYELDIKNLDKRTLKQNAAIHIYCELIADTFNDNNLPIEKVIKMNIQWTMKKVKEFIFKEVVKSLYQKDSTTKLVKKEFELIIDTITAFMATHNIEAPEFPNRKDLDKITVKNKDNK